MNKKLIVIITGFILLYFTVSACSFFRLNHTNPKDPQYIGSVAKSSSSSGM